MSYVFLIMVISSNSMNMQVEPMESMKQCRAAIQAISAAEQQRSWSETSPRVNNVKCVEVKK